MRQVTTGGVCPGAERVARFTVSVPSLRRLPPPFAGAGRGSLLLEPFNGVILASKPRGLGECPIISFERACEAFGGHVGPASCVLRDSRGACPRAARGADPGAASSG